MPLMQGKDAVFGIFLTYFTLSEIQVFQGH